jgi:beta-phosphoglucomutase
LEVRGRVDQPVTTTSRRFRGAILDVDGVLVASPHERAWREALTELMAREWLGLAAGTQYRDAAFTSAFYQHVVAGRPRLDGARAAVEAFGIPDVSARAQVYAERKQRRLEDLIAAGDFTSFGDGVAFAHALKSTGLKLAAASSSKNATDLLRRVGLLDLMDVDMCGRDLPHGKPDPLIFLVAARELGLPPAACFVVEDAPVGILAAGRAGMASVGVARQRDSAWLIAAGANLVVSSLDQVSIPALLEGRLERAAVAAAA